MSEPILAIGSFERAASVKERDVGLVEFKIANGKPLTMAIPKDDLLPLIQALGEVSAALSGPPNQPRQVWPAVTWKAGLGLDDTLQLGFTIAGGAEMIFSLPGSSTAQLRIAMDAVDQHLAKQSASLGSKN